MSAPSSETVQTWHGGRPVYRALIALGSNDATSPKLAENLLTLRRRVLAGRVTWLAPYHPGAAQVVTAIARSFGDNVVQLASYGSRDRVHPNSYSSVAVSLGWSGMGSSVPLLARRPSPQPPRATFTASPIRQAVVLSF
ncbi:hypothetical protein [Sphingomonas solaris]|uniref:hypothetical protein n=1 Tax=Alterirhizorhabdus solaris TaxID=2529389 RepID=UPI0011AA6651|nr:hypothetical protein [Sphingomonas solaris]